MGHLYWLGGSPCGGKSSVAETLSAQHGINYFKIDDHIEQCLQRVTAEEQPYLDQWKISSGDERWMLPIEILLQNAIGCYREHFQMLLPEILNLPTQPTLIEGNPVFPDQCIQLRIPPSKALWLIATPDFLRAQYARRDWIPRVLADCKNPRQAFDNWIERDVRFADWIRQECLKNGYTYHETSEQRSLDENIASVAHFFNLP